MIALLGGFSSGRVAFAAVVSTRQRRVAQALEMIRSGKTRS